MAEAEDMENLPNLFYSGIFLHKHKKYWVDEPSGCNCFMLFARELSITWGSDERYWKWLTLQKTSDGDNENEVACLLAVCWLNVYGKFEALYLTPGTIYVVVLIVMMAEGACNWDAPVLLRLNCPDGSVQAHKESLKEKPRGKWIELVLGEYTATVGSTGEIQFTLFESGEWKSGLLVKGAVIRPKE